MIYKEPYRGFFFIINNPEKIALYTLIIAALYSCNNKKTTYKKPITTLSLETTDKLSYSVVSKRERIMLNIKRKGDSIAGIYYY